MKTILSEQQTAFFTQNGYLELEIPHQNLFPLVWESKVPFGRDLWRIEPELQKFLIRKLGPIALALSGKKKLHLACDQQFLTDHRPKKAGPIKELFSIQGLCLGVALAQNPIFPAKRSPLGILPIPSNSETLLFFRPEFILDWPHVSCDLYIALYALSNAVYIHNSKDPASNTLKHLGYNFGDVLKNDNHPLIL